MRAAEGAGEGRGRCGGVKWPLGRDLEVRLWATEGSLLGRQNGARAPRRTARTPCGPCGGRKRGF